MLCRPGLKTKCLKIGRPCMTWIVKNILYWAYELDPMVADWWGKF